MTEPCYRYRATLVRVIDGDTAVLRLDLGFRVFAELKVRVAGVNTPERGKPGWGEARDFALRVLARPLIVESFKLGQSFERWVCAVTTVDEQGEASLYAQQLIDAGHHVDR